MIDSLTMKDMPQDNTFMVVNDTTVIDRTMISGKYGRIRCGIDYKNDQHVVCKMSLNERVISREVKVLQKLNEH